MEQFITETAVNLGLELTKLAVKGTASGLKGYPPSRA